MRSRNANHVLLVAFYVAGLGLYWPDLVSLLSGAPAAYLVASLVFPVAFWAQGRAKAGVAAVVMTLVFFLSLILIQQRAVNYTTLRSLAAQPPLAVRTFLFFVLPGLYLVSTLDADRLPHELARWAPRVGRPFLIVIATRERTLLRLASIREVCQVRGIVLTTPRDHLRRSMQWAVPLTISVICEAAYAERYRSLLASAHVFVPTRPKAVMTSATQQWFARAWVIVCCLGVLRALTR